MLAGFSDFIITLCSAGITFMSFLSVFFAFRFVKNDSLTRFHLNSLFENFILAITLILFSIIGYFYGGILLTLKILFGLVLLLISSPIISMTCMWLCNNQDLKKDIEDSNESNKNNSK
jgi:multisubunit Na+/H+ antiporter MnhG subunit